MPLTLKERPPLPPFTFSVSPPSSVHHPSRASSNSDAGPSNPIRPPADFMPERDMHMFGSHPLQSGSEPGRGLLECGRCGKVTMEWAMGDHKRTCNHVLDGVPLTTKKTTKGDKSIKDEVKKRRASEISDSTSGSPDKKRVKLPGYERAVQEIDPVPPGKMKKSEMKRMLKEKQKMEKKQAKERERMEIAERKRMRANGPVDYDRQCGVINDKGLPCSRSLTCKTHTVGAKRAVEGRTRSYDLLYLEWQRANNPNFKEPAPRPLKDSRRSEKRLSTSGLDGVKPKKKKVPNITRGDDDFALGEGEDGQRELEELLQLTRVAEGRVKDALIGINRPTPSTGGGSSAESRSSTVSRPQAIVSPSTGFGIWRSSSFEISQVGDMLTKALAARTVPRPLSKESKGGPGKGQSSKRPPAPGAQDIAFPPGLYGAGPGLPMNMVAGHGVGAMDVDSPMVPPGMVIMA